MNSDAVVDLTALVQQLIEWLVDDVEAVAVVVSRREGAVLLSVRVAPEDTGKIIGKQGRTARSLRTILGAAARKLETTIELSIEEEGKGA